MKKTASMVLVIVLVMSLISACGTANDEYGMVYNNSFFSMTLPAGYNLTDSTDQYYYFSESKPKDDNSSNMDNICLKVSPADKKFQKHDEKYYTKFYESLYLDVDVYEYKETKVFGKPCHYIHVSYGISGNKIDSYQYYVDAGTYSAQLSFSDVDGKLKKYVEKCVETAEFY